VTVVATATVGIDCAGEIDGARSCGGGRRDRGIIYPLDDIDEAWLSLGECREQRPNFVGVDEC
jgi:hypothetical protein